MSPSKNHLIRIVSFFFIFWPQYFGAVSFVVKMLNIQQSAIENPLFLVVPPQDNLHPPKVFFVSFVSFVSFVVKMLNIQQSAIRNQKSKIPCSSLFHPQTTFTLQKLSFVSRVLTGPFVVKKIT
jgi:hypothetical protein